MYESDLATMIQRKHIASLSIVFMYSMSFVTGRRLLGKRVGRQVAAFACRLGHGAVGPSHSMARQQLFSSSSSDEEEFDFDTVLPFEKNTHNSVKITVPQSNEDESKVSHYGSATFLSKLQATAATVQQLGKSAIWITVPMSRARLIEACGREGFEFHHAEGSEATLSKWLVEGQASRIPTYATHQVGVGAIVINEATDEILVVREKRNNYRPWKIPGGLTELGEHLDEAVCREVYEETGIETRFLNVLGVRHVHGSQFGRSDLYFVCKLEPILTEDGKLPKPTPQEGEIEAVSWIPMSEYREMVQNEDSNIGHPMMATFVKCVDQSSSIERLQIGSIVPGRKVSPLYHAPLQPDP